MGNIIIFENISMYKGDDTMENIQREEMLKIEDRVNELLKNVDLEESPYVDIVSLVKKDGFIVEPKEMDIETTGCLLVNEGSKDKKRLIYVNTIFKNPENETDVVFKKSRFITAHEYGHYILHKAEGESIYAHRDTYHRTEPMELEADYFARSILMPLKHFEMCHKLAMQISNDDETFAVTLLSKLFKVTKNKIWKRVGDMLVLNQ